MHPLGRIAVRVGIAFFIVAFAAFLWWMAAPIIGYLAPFWPLLAIAIGIGFLVWRFPASQFTALMAHPLARGLAIALLLTAIYASALWLLYGPGAAQVVSLMGIEKRTAWLIVSVLGLSAIPVIWHLYAAANIPGDPVTIGRAFRTLAFLSLLFFGWWFHATPNRFFDHRNGESLFWVAEKENKIYFSTGFSPATGEKLREGTMMDAEKFRQGSWLERAMETMFAETTTATQPTAAAAPAPLTLGCNEGYQELHDAARVQVVVLTTLITVPATPTEPEAEIPCWTPWLRHPRDTRVAILDAADGDIEVQKVFDGGKIEPPVPLSPLVRRFDGRLWNAVRFQNLGAREVSVTITLN